MKPSRLLAISLAVFALSAWGSIAALNDGLVLYYPFDTNAGSVAVDQSGTGNNGTVYGATFSANGRFGCAYEFDGSNDYIKIPASATLNTPDHFSLCAFFKTYNDREQRPILSWHSVSPSQSGVHMCTEIYGYQWQGRGTGAHMVGVDGYEHNLNHVISISDPPLNQWHYLVITYDSASGVGRLYLDGVLATEKNMGSYQPQMSFDAYVGAIPEPGGLWLKFCGLLDEIRVYNRVISAAEVLALYENRLNTDPAWVTLIGFSNDPEGDQDVTEFYRDETLYIRVRDVDLEADDRASVRVMLQQARSGMRMINLERQVDGAFTGSIPLRRFRPGRVRVFIQSNSRTRLMKDSAFTIRAD